MSDSLRRCVVISQPMFFPWVGFLEQMRLADVYVHYDDVQFSKGSFTNRVQIKTAQGSQWLSVPLKELSLGTLIRDTLMDDRKDWRKTHRTTLAQAYAKAPHRTEMLALVDEVYAGPAKTICELSVASLMAVHRYFGFLKPTEFCFSSAMNLPGSGSQRVLAVVQACGGKTYLTGHGARRYLDHELFELAGVQVEYIDYQKRHYPQLHGEFTPFVSVLDLIANCGKAGGDVFVSSGVGWREFLARESSDAAAVDRQSEIRDRGTRSDDPGTC